MTPPPPAAPPVRPRRARTFRDLPFLAVLLAALVGFLSLRWPYPGSAGAAIPRQPSEFPPAAELEQIQSSALAALAADPDDLSALVDLAVASYQQGPDRYSQALEHLEKARDLGALDPRLFYYAGVMYESRALNEYAAEDYSRFLRHQPGDLETRLRLANLYYRMGELEKAAAAYRKVLAERPRDALVSFNLAVVCRDREQWQEGLALLEAVLERDKTLSAGGFKVLGDLYRGAKEPLKALEKYEWEALRNPDDPALAAARARAHEDAGDHASALAQWEEVQRLDPKNRDARNRIRVLKRKLRAAKK